MSLFSRNCVVLSRDGAWRPEAVHRAFACCMEIPRKSWTGNEARCDRGPPFAASKPGVREWMAEPLAGRLKSIRNLTPWEMYIYAGFSSRQMPRRARGRGFAFCGTWTRCFRARAPRLAIEHLDGGAAVAPARAFSTHGRGCVGMLAIAPCAGLSHRYSRLAAR